MKKLILSLSLILAAVPSFAKKNSSQNVLDLKYSITDPAIVYPESFESDTNKLLESWFVKNYTATDDRYDTEKSPNVTDEEIIERLAALPTVIEMPYNSIVRKYIDRYTVNGRRLVSALLGLGLYYTPIFEQALEEQGLPLELKYLPMIESALDPNAVSKHGATGLWQFMLATAKGLGMEVNSLVDERRDPYLSSEMAAAYLKGLYDSYSDWSLAIAAYNCGPGTVNKAIRRAGGDPASHDFWTIYNYLPAETRGYVPLFIAINYVMNYYPEHNISPVLPTAPLVMDTIHVSDRIHFNQISQVLDIPVEELRILNPQYRADIIPGTVDVPRNLILPSQQIHAYLMSEDDIKNYDSERYNQRTIVNPGDLNDVPEDEILAVEDTEIWAEPDPIKPGQQTATIIHKVKEGETLASIAEMYEITPQQIKTSNNLRRNAVRIGQQLRITSASPQAHMENTVAVVTNNERVSAPTKAAENSAAKKQTSTQSQKQTTAQQKQTTTQKQTNNKQTAANNNKAANNKAANNKAANNKAANTKAKQTQKAAKPSSHDIKSGENLTTIAKKYGVSVDELKKANNMKDDKLKAGGTIKIPAKGKAATNNKATQNNKKGANNKNTKNNNTKKKK
ncbi:MAG: transglycosylase SLT domain-containing protein [Muribaculaceae bacterium]|nr:transglycosylase SLT domain-containing protein [Muribaculaceae bacterium]